MIVDPGESDSHGWVPNRDEAIASRGQRQTAKSIQHFLSIVERKECDNSEKFACIGAEFLEGQGS